MKTAILLCTKDANNYLCEYVEYYRKLNFSNIILVDNSKEDNVYDILDKDDDFIIYEDYKERQFNHTIFVFCVKSPKPIFIAGAFKHSVPSPLPC